MPHYNYPYKIPQKISLQHRKFLENSAAQSAHDRKLNRRIKLKFLDEETVIVKNSPQQPFNHFEISRANTDGIQLRSSSFRYLLLMFTLICLIEPVNASNTRSNFFKERGGLKKTGYLMASNNHTEIDIMVEELTHYQTNNRKDISISNNIYKSYDIVSAHGNQAGGGITIVERNGFLHRTNNASEVAQIIEAYQQGVAVDDRPLIVASCYAGRGQNGESFGRELSERLRRIVLLTNTTVNISEMYLNTWKAYFPNGTSCHAIFI